MGRVTADRRPASQPSRAEWWWPLALAALALLAVEWLLFHRPTRRTLARAFGAGRSRSAGGRDDPAVQLLRPGLAVAGAAGGGDRRRRLVGRVAHASCRSAHRVARHPALAGGVPRPVAGRDATGPSVDRLSVVFLLDASASMLDATREDLVDWARAAAREARGGHGRRRRLRGQRAGRSPSIGARRARRAGLGAGVGATDVAAAVRLAAAILPAGTQHRSCACPTARTRRAKHRTRSRRPPHVASAWMSVTPPTSRRPRCWSTPSTRRRAPGSARPSICRARALAITTRSTLRLGRRRDGRHRELELEPGITSVPFCRSADEPGFHVSVRSSSPGRPVRREQRRRRLRLVTGAPQVLVATDGATRAADFSPRWRRQPGGHRRAPPACPARSPRRPATTPSCSTTSTPTPLGEGDDGRALGVRARPRQGAGHARRPGEATAPAASSTRRSRRRCRCT